MNKFNHFKYIASVIFFGSIIILLTGCFNKQKSAKDYLNTAETAYKKKDYIVAKNNIDSIKMKYPKAFNEIKAGFKLLLDVREGENQRNISFCDSMLKVNDAILKDMLKDFRYVKDKRYQEKGTYIPKAISLNQYINHNTIRSGVTEQGQLYLESVLVGQNIKHTQMKAVLPNNEFAETLSVTSDGFNYRFKTAENNYEIVRYIGKDENGVSKFICMFRKEAITIYLIGSKTIRICIPEKEKEAICQCYQLSNIILNMNQLKYEKEKSQTLIRYLKRRK